MPAATVRAAIAIRTVPKVPPCTTTAAASAPTAAAGSVTSQATAIRPTVLQRTSASRLPSPAPRMPPEQTCVVDSAKPRWAEVRITAVEAVSAANPCGDWMSVIPLPMVRMIRQPPMYVPRPMASPADAITHSGGPASGPRVPTEIRVRVMTPMVFCASLVPCASETSDAEAICPTRKPRVTDSPRARLLIRYTG